MSKLNPPEPTEWEGEPLVATLTVTVTQRQLDWIRGNVADYRLGPTPEFLDESAVIRETIHGQMMRDLEVDDAYWNRMRDNDAYQ